MFFGAKLKRCSEEKREVVLDECDLEVLDIVVDYMYGIDIPNLVCNINETFNCSSLIIIPGLPEVGQGTGHLQNVLDG